MPTKRRFARLAELAGLGHGRGLGPAGAHRHSTVRRTPDHHELLGPLFSSGYAALFRRSATRKAAPSCAAAQGCGRPVRVSRDTSVASSTGPLREASFRRLRGPGGAGHRSGRWVLLCAPATQARRQKNDLASSSPVFSHAGSLVAEQAFNYRPYRIVVTASVG